MAERKLGELEQRLTALEKRVIIMEGYRLNEMAPPAGLFLMLSVAEKGSPAMSFAWLLVILWVVYLIIRPNTVVLRA